MLQRRGLCVPALLDVQGLEGTRDSRWASVSMRQRLCGVQGDSILSPNTAAAECVCGFRVSACKERSRPANSQISLSLKSSLTLRSAGPAGLPGLALCG